MPRRSAAVASLFFLFTIGTLSGCALTASQLPTAAVPSTGVAPCVGTIDPPYGLARVTDPVLLASALGKPGAGGLCTGQVFQVTQPLTVYRVWDASRSTSRLGRWWSFEPPAGPVDAYRVKNEICPAWSSLDRVTQCHLKVGAQIAIGPGQSARCDDRLTYPPSAEIQVFVPNDTRDAAHAKIDVIECEADVAWP